MSEPKDPDEYVRAYGINAFRAVLALALPVAVMGPTHITVKPAPVEPTDPIERAIFRTGRLYWHSHRTRMLAHLLVEAALERYKLASARLAKVEDGVAKMIDRKIQLSRHDRKRVVELLDKVRRDEQRANFDLEDAIDLFTAAHTRVADVMEPPELDPVTA